VRFHLERAGFRVSEAADGQQALAQVREAVPDVLLLDLSMPDVDGWKVLDVVRAEGQLNTMRVALLTAESDEMVEHRARRAGAHAYLVKPLDGGDLTRAVQRLLDDRDVPA
jgi:CheY-like chemotaxis protein